MCEIIKKEKFAIPFVIWYNRGKKEAIKPFLQIGSGDHMLKQTKKFLEWQAKTSKAVLTTDQKRRARFKAMILKQELTKIVDKKYQAELDADSDSSSSSYELSGNLGFGSSYHGDDEAPSGSVGNYGEIDMDGFHVVDTEGLSDDEKEDEDQF